MPFVVVGYTVVLFIYGSDKQYTITIMIRVSMFCIHRTIY